MSRHYGWVIAAGSLLPALASSESAQPLSALAKIPVREITVFKDGHAFVLHEGRMKVDSSGNLVLDHLPTPILGTFWPYSADKRAKLTMVTAARQRVLIEQTALTLRELLEANVGHNMLVTEASGPSYPATLVGMPARTSAEVQATAAPGGADAMPAKGNLALLKTAEGTKAVAVDRIQDVKLLGEYRTKVSNEDFRSLLTLHLDWAGRPEATAEVGMIYVQKGLRWIPNYQIELDGAGKAVAKLQATLLNELVDFKDATLHLVIGVPTFAFKDTIDPMALGQTLAQLSPYFEGQTQVASNFSNTIMTQMARMSERPQPGGQPADLGPELPAGTRSEDLFFYTLKNVSLKKGQRLVLPVAQHTLDYKDHYSLEIPYAPPTQFRGNLNDAQRNELARLLEAPKVMHKIRLQNRSPQPLTTAPAMLIHKQRVLAQGLMTYTAAGGSTDLTITTAVDVRVKKTETEGKRTSNALNWNGDTYSRTDLAGKLSLANHRPKAIELEVVRHVLGQVGEADHNGKAEMINALEDYGAIAPAGTPAWWRSYSWPGWWHNVNGVGRVTWQLKLEPGESVDLNYAWHYYWR